MFTIWEKFIASDAWMRLSVLGSLIFALCVLFKSLEPSVAALQSPLFLLLTLFAVPATVLLTLVLSPFLAFAIFEGMVERQARKNGGPFSVGDRVIVIAGRHSGKCGVITSYGQCGTLRITLDDGTSEFGSYSHYQLKRMSEASGELKGAASSRQIPGG